MDGIIAVERPADHPETGHREYDGGARPDTDHRFTVREGIIIIILHCCCYAWCIFIFSRISIIFLCCIC